MDLRSPTTVSGQLEVTDLTKSSPDELTQRCWVELPL